MMGTAPKDIDYLSTTWFIACRSGNLSLVVTLLFSGDHFSNLPYLLKLQDPDPSSTTLTQLFRDDPELAKEAAAWLGSSFVDMTGLHVALTACFGKSSYQYDPEPFANRTTERMFELRKQIVLQLIEVSSPSDLEATFGYGNTALHLATLLGERDIVQALLRKGAMPSVENDMRFTPIQLARGEHADDIRKLIGAADASLSSSPLISHLSPSRQVHASQIRAAGSPGSTVSISTSTTNNEINSHTASRLVSAKRALEISPDKHMPSASVSRHDTSAPESAPKSVRLTPETEGEDSNLQPAFAPLSSPLSRTLSLLASDGLRGKDGETEDDDEIMADKDSERVEDVQRRDVKVHGSNNISAVVAPNNFHNRVVVNNAAGTRGGSQEMSPLSPSQTGGSLSPFHRLSISGQKSLSPPSPSLLRSSPFAVQAQEANELRKDASVAHRSTMMDTAD